MHVAVSVLLCAVVVTGAAPSNSGHPAPTTVAIPGGVIAYDVTGMGHTVVLLHGGALDRRMWDDQVPALAVRYRVIRVDSRGHGRSSDVAGPYSNVDDLYAVLKATRTEHAVLVGLSLGGRTVLDFALAHPEMTDAVVAVSPGMSGYEFTDPLLAESNAAIAKAARTGDVDAVVELLQRSWTDGPKRAPGQVPPEVRERVRVMLHDTLTTMRGRGEVRELGAASRLRQIRCPVLAVLGDLDMADIHTIVDRIGREVPRARVVVVRGAAHMLNMEKPEELNRILLDFLAAVDRPRLHR